MQYKANSQWVCNSKLHYGQEKTTVTSNNSMNYYNGTCLNY